MLEDHPHACGDKRHLLGRHSPGQGSSPCVWGQGRKARRKQKVLRIIPMRVGTRRFWNAQRHLRRDHPHACGDKLLHKLQEKKFAGSSPCVWGQDAKYRICYPSVGIIPMRVGTSTLGKATDTYHKGSSPCVWGQV